MKTPLEAGNENEQPPKDPAHGRKLDSSVKIRSQNFAKERADFDTKRRKLPDIRILICL